MTAIGLRFRSTPDAASPSSLIFFFSSFSTSSQNVSSSLFANG